MKAGSTSAQCSAVQWQYSTVLQYSTVYYSEVQYSVVQYSAVQYSVLQYSAAVQYSVLQCRGVQCSTVYYSAVKYSTEQCTGRLHLTSPVRAPPQCAVTSYARPCRAIHCIALLSADHCSALQCVAAQCSVLQCSAVQCSAVHCSVLQHSAVQALLSCLLHTGRAGTLAPLPAAPPDLAPIHPQLLIAAITHALPHRHTQTRTDLGCGPWSPKT